MKTAGQYIVAALEAAGLGQIFGIPGVHNLELYAALAYSRLRHVGARHEQGVGFMADGYARVSGRPGVCFTITGPGLTNIITAMGQAYGDSIPMLVISSHNPRTMHGGNRGLLHELKDQFLIASQVSGFSARVTHAAELPEVLSRAFAGFASCRPRPAYIEIPRDVLAEGAECLPLPYTWPERSAAGASPHEVARAAERIAASRRPVLLVGGGARQAAVSVARFAERTGAPVVMTTNARGLLPPEDPLAVPCSPSLPPVRDLMSSADLVVAVGTEFGETDYDMLFERNFVPPGNLIRIDIEPEQTVRNAVPDIALVGDAGATLDSLLERDLGPARTTTGHARARATREASLAALSAPMRAALEWLIAARDAVPGSILVGDSTQPVYAGNLGFAAATPGSWFNSATGFGTLGYALPAAVGAAIAAPDRPVICVIGDGGLQFSLAELGVPGDVGAWLAVLVWNNRGYGEIKASMRSAGLTPVAVDVAPPDLRLLARAYGLVYRQVRDPQALRRELEEFARRRQVIVIEVNVTDFEAG